MGVADAVRLGSTVHDSEYVHSTTDITVAAHFARGGSGQVVTLNRRKLEADKLGVLDLGRERCGRCRRVWPLRGRR